MLSEETQQRLANVAAEQDRYCPSAETKAKLGDKTLIMLVGATCMGKSTIMAELEKRGSAIATVNTITTRPPRPDDARTRYHYFEHTTDGLQPLLADIDAGKLVQFVVNPRSGFIYGSYPEDYPAQVNIGDYFSSVVEQFKTYGFGTVLCLSVIANPKQWRRRFESRFPTNHPERTARLLEATDSLRWSLGQPAIQWVINRDNESEMAATSVEMAIRGEMSQNQTEAKKLAEECLLMIKELSHV